MKVQSLPLGCPMPPALLRECLLGGMMPKCSGLMHTEGNYLMPGSDGIKVVCVMPRMQRDMGSSLADLHRDMEPLTGQVRWWYALSRNHLCPSAFSQLYSDLLAVVHS